MQRARFLTTAAYGLAAAPALATAAFAQTVSLKIGFLDSLTGGDALAASHHQAGANLAIAELNRQSHVVQYELVPRDDGGQPSNALNEVRSLVEENKVDLLFGGTSSACASSRGATAATLGVFDLELGADDPRLTGANATRTTYRFAPNRQMKVDAVTRYVVSLRKRTYVLHRDDEFGAQAFATVSAALAPTAGALTGHTALAVDSTSRRLVDPSAALSAARASQAELLVLAVRSVDIQALIAAIVQEEVDRRMQIAALCELPWGATAADNMIFPVIWSPDATAAARALESKLRRAVNGDVSADHYLGYAAMMNLGDVLARARTTDTARLTAAFDHAQPFEAAKTTRSFWQSCDHQCAQDVYVGRWFRPRASSPVISPFRIVSTLPAASSDPCASPSAQAAQTRLRSQRIESRGNYTPKTW